MGSAYATGGRGTAKEGQRELTMLFGSTMLEFSSRCGAEVLKGELSGSACERG